MCLSTDFPFLSGCAVGMVSSLYGRFFRGNAFMVKAGFRHATPAPGIERFPIDVKVTGILFQPPLWTCKRRSLQFGQQCHHGHGQRLVSTRQLASACIGLTVGLGISLVVVFPMPSWRRQGKVFSL
ncbi:hypothetical protein BKA62DRAFT_104448 [Auriculariales sp. MPI-PUGE-AT-0066]|nr:hypothetical protein BKA62DRAFT_104448 [Auriculariales sp. MPI-PUGE-AT-0066]